MVLTLCVPVKEISPRTGISVTHETQGKVILSNSMEMDKMD